MNMENLPFKIDNNDYVKLPRSIKTALVDGLLEYEEYALLVWLWLIANPRSGRAHVSYAGLAKDFKDRYLKNRVNKFMLELKRKKWVWFVNQQGRRSSFNVDISEYPLSDGTFKYIEHNFQQKSGRSEDTTDKQSLTEAPAEVDDISQKLESEKKKLVARFSFTSAGSRQKSEER